MSRVVDVVLGVPLGPGPIVVVSPHLDDAILSLGGTIAELAARGREVVVVTVLAGDASSSAPAGGWDRSGGFATEGEATLARRAEDERACARVGGTPIWLAFRDGAYERVHDADAVTGALVPLVDGVAAVLAPGHPLAHPDHAFVAGVLAGIVPSDRLLAYAEQPYAARTELGRAPTGPGWARLRPGLVARSRKLRAVASYRSQLPMLGLSQRLGLGLGRIVVPQGGIGTEWLRGPGSGPRLPPAAGFRPPAS